MFKTFIISALLAVAFAGTLSAIPVPAAAATAASVPAAQGHDAYEVEDFSFDIEQR